MQLILRQAVLFALLLSAVPAFAGWRSLGPDGGTVVALAVDPGDSRIVYAASQLPGRLYKTVDGGETWRLSDQGLPVEGAIRTLAVDPRRRATVWAATASRGVYKSTDGGASWTASLPPRAGFNGTVSDLAVDPRRPAVVYAATSAGIFKTSNGGGEWRLKSVGLPGEVFVVEADPSELGRAYASAGLNGLYRTLNGGETWERVRRGLPANDPVLSLAAAPGVVYAGTNGGRVLKSTDGGRTWLSAGAGLPEEHAVASLAIHPRTPRIVYAGLFDFSPPSGAGLYRSGNGGASWAPAAAGLTNQEVWELAFGSPGTGLPGAPLYAATGGETSPGGVFRSDDGRTWRRVVRGLSAQPVRDVAAEPGDPGVLWAAAGNLGLFRSPDGGLSWAHIPLAADLSHVFALARDPRFPGTLYALADVRVPASEPIRFAIFKTNDSGSSWTRTAPPPGGFVGLEADPRNGDLYILGNGFSRSTDEGATWSRPAGLSEFILDMAFPESAPQVVYAAGFRLGGRFEPPQARVLKSEDGGATWTRSDAGLEGVFQIQRIVALPGAPSTLFATDGVSIFRTTDAGVTWERTFGPSAVDVIRELIVAPDGTLYAYSTSRGVFTSRDGAVWTPFAPPLHPTASTERLILDPDDPETIYAASTFGVQVYRKEDQ